MILNLQQNHLLGIYILPVNNILNKFYLFWSTGFLTGFFPKAPGTIGALIGILIFLLSSSISLKFQLLFFSLYLFISIKSIPYAIYFFKKNDPSQVNCDEIIGIWIALLFFQPAIKVIVFSFIIFRILDILKPFPIIYVEKLPGSYGIIADDVVAGVLTKVIIWIIMKTL